MSEWVKEETTNASTEIWHLDGVPWHEAQVPRRTHRCRAQTMGVIDLDSVERCACGAIRLVQGRRLNRSDPWAERNSRRGRWMSNLGGHTPDE